MSEKDSVRFRIHTLLQKFEMSNGRPTRTSADDEHVLTEKETQEVTDFLLAFHQNMKLAKAEQDPEKRKEMILDITLDRPFAGRAEQMFNRDNWILADKTC